MADETIQIKDMPPVASALRDTKIPGQRADGSPASPTIAQILQALAASDLTVFGGQILSAPGATGTIASDPTCDIGAATEFQLQVTGTTTITSFGTATDARKRLFFLDAVTLTHDGTSLILPGAADITTEAGDVFEFASDAAGNWRCVGYMLAGGLGITSGSSITLQNGFGETVTFAFASDDQDADLEITYSGADPVVIDHQGNVTCKTLTVTG
ncbi:hypothetical protein IWQ49_006358 [Labrenzia sp. EL_126]|nr:hypothetical protein [Labrenzia sp. EL_126]